MPPELSMSLGSSFFKVVQAATDDFPWEQDHAVWVTGPIGDSLLKKLQGGQDLRMPSPPMTPMTPSSPSSPSWRRGRCTIEGSTCRQYDPIIFVPHSLMDSLEVSADLKYAVKRLMEDASEPGHGRLELLPNLPLHDVYFDIQEAMPGVPVFSRGGICGRFKVRQERWHREMRQSSHKVAMKRLADQQFVLNERLLPELVTWCDQYKAIKARRLAEKAELFSEEAELARQRRERSSRQMKDPHYVESSDLVERGQLRAAKIARAAGKAAADQLESAVEVCKCGYHHVWHEGYAALTFHDLQLSSTMSSTWRPEKPLEAPVARPGSSPLIVQSQPQKVEAVVSAGRLLRAGSAILST